MSYPPNYARTDVLRAAGEIQSSASYYAGQIASYSSMGLGNTARQYASQVANSALSSIETAAISAALSGAGPALQTAVGSRVAATAQLAALGVRRAEVISGVSPAILADAQGAAASAADALATQYEQAVTAAVPSVIPVPAVFGRSAPCNSGSVVQKGIIEISAARPEP